MEPVPFKRFVLNATFPQNRSIVFEVRDCERATPQGVKEGKYWKSSHVLGAEWDDPIKEYWSKCNIAKDWDRRMNEVEATESKRAERLNGSNTEQKVPDVDENAALKKTGEHDGAEKADDEPDNDESMEDSGEVDHS